MDNPEQHSDDSNTPLCPIASGEIIARLTRERDEARNSHASLKEVWDAQCAHVLEACKMLGVDTDKIIGDSWTLREWRHRVTAERDALAKFKAFVHRRLDEGSVPADPPGEHRDRGCRVGQRLAWLFAERDEYAAAQNAAANDYRIQRGRADAAEAKLAGLRAWLVTCAETSEAAYRAKSNGDDYDQDVAPSFAARGRAFREVAERIGALADQAAVTEAQRENAVRAVRIQFGERSVSPEEVVDMVIAALAAVSVAMKDGA